MEKEDLIRLENIEFVRERRRILRDINLTVKTGDFLAITGPNGGGKTTLLRIMLRLVKPTGGTVTYLDNGTTVKNLSIGYLPQKNMIDSRFPITVRQVVESGLLTCREISKKETERLTDEMISKMGLDDRHDTAIEALSGGQLQRTLLGRALISKPSILVLDEPLSYVDKQFESRIYDMTAELSTHTTIVMVSHEMSRIAAMANRHIIIDRTLTECSARHHAFISPCPEKPDIPKSPICNLAAK